MEQSNLKNTASTHKWLILAALLLPLIGYASINSFDLLKANRLDVDNIRLDANTISTTNANGDLTFDMNGTGSVIFTDLSADTVPYLNGSKKLTSSSVTSTQLATLANATASNTASTLVLRNGSGNFSAGTITANLTGNVTGNLTGNVTGNVTGNADTATALASNPSDCASDTYATTIAASGNLTCATVTNAGLAGSIAASKLVATTASRALVSDGSGFLSAATTTSTEIGYVNGVTSAIQTQINTKAPAASPTFTGTVTTPVTASRALVTGASSELAVATTTATEIGYVNGVTSAIQTQINAITAAASQSYEISNCSIAASVAASALTISLKDAAGSDPSGGSPCKIGFRNATATTGTYTQVSTTAAVSVVLSNGSALGCTASVACTAHVYAIYTGSAVVLGIINGAMLDEGAVYTSTVLAGSGGDDSGSVLYSTAAQASKPIRLIGRVIVTPAAAFAWTNAPAVISNVPFRLPYKGATLQIATSGTGATYTAPSNPSPAYIIVELVGGGGSGQGGGTGAPGTGTDGGTSTYSDSYGTSLSAGGGSKGSTGGSGGAGSGGDYNISGGEGGGALLGSTTQICGGTGGGSQLGRGGNCRGANAAGGAAQGYGAGSGGGGASVTTGGFGGGGGAYARKLIVIPNQSVAYTGTYTIGAGAAGGGAGTNGQAGGTSSAGILIVHEFYQ